MFRFHASAGIVVASLCLCTCYAQGAGADDPARTEQAGAAAAPEKLTVTVGKSMVIDSPVNIQRISYANGDLVEAVAISPKEVLINGKSAGETSLIIWQQGGNRLLYDLTVRLSSARLDAVRQQIARDFPNDDINITYENDTAFVRGAVKDTIAADRVMAMVATLGKSVNLLRVEVPPAETQILIRVKFANVDRGASMDLGLNLASSAFNQATQVTTGQFPSPSVSTAGTISISDALNILMFRKDINLGATLKDLESKRLLETLAEPNVLASNGKPASFVSGGEFPYPMVQGGSAVGAVSIAFRDFGIKLNFLPHITPRGTIQLLVQPEVSALDFANAVTFQGYTIPALNTRRVSTEIELESGQSFVIAGLMDNTMTETINRIRGLSDIPLLGKLFTSRSTARSNSELMVLVTPEVVQPVPEAQAPQVKMPVSFMKPNSDVPMRHPGIDKTGVPPAKPPQTMPLEELILKRKEGQPAPIPTLPPYMMVPMPAGNGATGQQSAQPAAAPAAPAGGGAGK